LTVVLLFVQLIATAGIATVQTVTYDEDTSKLLEQYNKLENDELREQVFIELFIDYVESFERFVQIFQANPNDSALDGALDEFNFNFAHLSNVLEAVYDKDKLSEPIQMVLPLINLHSKLGSFALIPQILLKHKDNQPFTQSVLDSSSPLLAFLKVVSSELDAGGYVETVDEQVNFAQNYGTIQQIEAVLANEPSAKAEESAETTSEEVAAITAEFSDSKASDPKAIEEEKVEEEAKDPFTVSDTDLKSLEDIVWTCRAEFETMQKSLASAITASASDGKKTSTLISEGSQAASVIKGQQSALQTLLDAQADPNAFRENYSAHLQLVDELGQVSFQCDQVAQKCAQRFKVLKENADLLARVASFSKQGEDLSSTVITLTGDKKADWSEKFKANTSEAQAAFLGTFTPQAQRLITDGSSLVSELEKLKAASADKKDLAKAIKNRAAAAKKEEQKKDDAQLRKNKGKKWSKTAKAKAQKELEDKAVELQNSFSKVATTFKDESEAESEGEVDAKSSQANIQNSNVQQQIIAYRKLIKDRRGSLLSEDEYKGATVWLTSIEAATKEVRYHSSNLQRNYEAFTPGRRKKLKSFAKEAKSVVKELSIPKADLQADGFFVFGARSEPQMQMLSIGSFFKSIGNKVKDTVVKVGTAIKDTAVKVGQTVVNTVVPVVAKLMNSSNAVKVDGAIDVRNKNVSGKNWMSGLPDNTPMWKVSYPATHDTMTFLKEDGQTFESCKATCQRYNLRTQMDLGCRWFDIRKADIGGRTRIVHGDVTYQGTVENDIVAVAVEFIQNNPSEVVFLAGTGPGNYFENNPNKKHFRGDGGSSNNTMKEYRGKVVFGFPEPIESVDTAEWQGPTFEELYNDGIAGIGRANNLGAGKIPIHGVSATAGLQSGSKIASMLTGKQSLTPEGYSDYMNPRIRNYLTAHKEIKKVGIMKFDFVGPDSKNEGKELNPAVIYQLNFR
ncbi:MAG: hypothetical protein LBI41_00360, partial [Lactobacillales bacterium]|nr:hypothetical protein [Lactobacillales bacterium]